jgi:hypothetical protein
MVEAVECFQMPVATKKGAIWAAMAATVPAFTWSLSLLTGGLVQNGSSSVKGAPSFGAAQRTLGREDRSNIIKLEEKGPPREPRVAPFSPPLKSRLGIRITLSTELL